MTRFAPPPVPAPFPFDAYQVGARVVCVEAGSTLLVKGQTYTVKDHAEDPPTRLIEVCECPGYLFHPLRFEPMQ